MEIRELKLLFDKMRADESFTVRDITGSYQACTSSYLVGPKSVRRVASALKRGLDGHLPIDLLIRQEAKKGHLTLGCVFPFVTTIQVDQETAIRGRSGDRAQFSKKAIDLLRYSFFVDRDFAHTASIIAAMEANSDPHRELIERVLGFATSDQFVEFVEF